MITRHVSLNSKVYSAPAYLALLVLLAWSGAAPGATGAETRCDQTVRAQDMPDTRTASLSIEVVDHGAARSSGTIESSPEIDSDADADEGTPPMKALLRRILDEPQLRPVDTTGADEADDMAAPMAVDQVETVEEAASKVQREEARETAAGLPGVSEDDLIRFRRQMYRTDI